MRLWWTAAVPWVLACGADSGGLKDANGEDGSAQGGAAGDPEIEQRCQDSVELLREAAATRCECLVAAGERPDQASCVAEFVAVESDVECMCSIYASHPETDGFLDCFVPLQQTQVDCMVDALCDAAKLDACDEAFALRSECPLPDAAADEVAAMCTPS